MRVIKHCALVPYCQWGWYIFFIFWFGMSKTTSRLGITENVGNFMWRKFVNLTKVLYSSILWRSMNLNLYFVIVGNSCVVFKYFMHLFERIRLRTLEKKNITFVFLELNMCRRGSSVYYIGSRNSYILITEKVLVAYGLLFPINFGVICFQSILDSLFYPTQCI